MIGDYTDYVVQLNTKQMITGGSTVKTLTKRGELPEDRRLDEHRMNERRAANECQTSEERRSVECQKDDRREVDYNSSIPAIRNV